MKLKCIICDDIVNTKKHKGQCYFQSSKSYNDVICQDCADTNITYIRYIDNYICGNTDKETLTDDEVNNLETFVIKDVDDLELYDDEEE